MYFPTICIWTIMESTILPEFADKIFDGPDCVRLLWLSRESTAYGNWKSEECHSNNDLSSSGP